MAITYVVLGIILLTFGRRLFWLFVAALGFLTGYSIAMQYGINTAHYAIWLISIICGVAGALIAIFLQRLAVAMAGFFAGAYLMFHLMTVLNIYADPLFTITQFIGGFTGLVLFLLFFDDALIVISALVGASLVVRYLYLDIPVGTVCFVILTAIGIACQYHYHPLDRHR